MNAAVWKPGAPPEPDGPTVGSWTPVLIVSPKAHKFELREPDKGWGVGVAMRSGGIRVSTSPDSRDFDGSGGVVDQIEDAVFATTSRVGGG
jgi:hypothetical protein